MRQSMMSALKSFEPSDGLWASDLGVTSATIALSALRRHACRELQRRRLRRQTSRRVPLCRVLHRRSRPGDAIISIARAAGVGVRSNGVNGFVQIFGSGDLDLLRFAETAVKGR